MRLEWLRSLGLYLVLVGIPALGISVVLQAGKGLRAPPSFAGSWRVETAPDSACRRDPLQVIVEQSGPALEVRTYDGIRLVGQVRGDSFDAEGPNHRRIRARRLPGRSSPEWEGIATRFPCDSAKDVLIRATRLQLPRELRGH